MAMTNEQLQQLVTGIGQQMGQQIAQAMLQIPQQTATSRPVDAGANSNHNGKTELNVRGFHGI